MMRISLYIKVHYKCIEIYRRLFDNRKPLNPDYKGSRMDTDLQNKKFTFEGCLTARLQHEIK